MIRMLALLALTACGGGLANAPDNSVPPGDDCLTSAQCQDGLVCLAYGSQTGTCVAECTASADACGAEATCSGVGAASIDVCQDNDDITEPGQVPTEEERPRVACASDAECGELAPGTICVEWEGFAECTLPCSSEPECDTPAVGGFSADLLTCLPDEADPSRSGCVPDKACFADPLSCVEGFPNW